MYSLEERSEDDVTVLVMSGKITICEGSVALRSAVRRLLYEGKKKILINLQDITYTDSSGLGELVSSYTTVKNRGGRIKYVFNQGITNLLRETKLLSIFETFDTEQAALESFRKGEGDA